MHSVAVGCIFDGNNRRSPIICCYGRWLNTTDSVNTDHSDGTLTERKRDALAVPVHAAIFFFCISRVLGFRTSPPAKSEPPPQKKHFGSFRVFLVIVERVWLDSALCSSPWTSCGIARKTCSELPISFNAPISCRAPSDVCVFFKFLRRPRVFAKQQSMIPRKMRNDRRQNRSSDRVLSSVRSNNVPSS